MFNKTLTAIALIIMLASLPFLNNTSAKALTKTNINLKYFGYYNDYRYYADYERADRSIGESFGQIKALGNSNFVHFNAGHSNLGFDRIVLQQAKNNNLKSLVNFQTLTDKFFDTTKTYTNTDFEKVFAIIENTLRGYEDQVLALYVADEPNLTLAQEARFVDLTLRIKNRFPQYKRFVTLAYPQLITPLNEAYWKPATSNLLTHITDVAFDGYKFTGFTTDNIVRQKYIDKMAQLANKNQDLWLIPDSTIDVPHGICLTNPNSLVSEKQFLVQVMNDYYQLANNNPRVVGLMPFVWDVREEISTLNWIDTRKMFNSGDPCYSLDVKKKHIEVGKNILNISSAPILPPSTVGNSQNLIWRHKVTGENVVWYMNGANFKSGTKNPIAGDSEFIYKVPDANWDIKASGK